MFIPGLGLFTSEARSSEIQFGSGTIVPPSARIEFSQRQVDVPSEFHLRHQLINRYDIIPSRADELIGNFVSEIRNSLLDRKPFTIPSFGTLSSDLEGNIQFLPLENHLYNLSCFGLLPVKAQSLAIQNKLNSTEHEAPIIPLRPFDEGEKKRNWLPVMAYAAIGAGLSIAAGSLIWLSTLGQDPGQQASMLPVIPRISAAAISENNTPSGDAGVLAQEVQSQPAPSSLKYFVVAGSFRNPSVASEAESNWKKAGFSTSIHPNTEKEMSRVAIGEFLSKEEALTFLNKKQAEFSSRLWILKEEDKKF